jgi:hypothetical protein
MSGTVTASLLYLRRFGRNHWLYDGAACQREHLSFFLLWDVRAMKLVFTFRLVPYRWIQLLCLTKYIWIVLLTAHLIWTGLEDFEEAEGRLPGHLTPQDLPDVLAFWKKACEAQVCRLYLCMVQGQVYSDISSLSLTVCSCETDHVITSMLSWYVKCSVPLCKSVN